MVKGIRSIEAFFCNLRSSASKLIKTPKGSHFRSYHQETPNGTRWQPYRQPLSWWYVSIWPSVWVSTWALLTPCCMQGLCIGVRFGKPRRLGASISNHVIILGGMQLLIHGLTSAVAVEVTVYPKKYAHGFCFAGLCFGYTLTDFPISIRLTSLGLWQSNDCPSASKATLMNMDKYFMWIHHERLHNHNKAKHNKTVCIFLGIYCKLSMRKYTPLFYVGAITYLWPNPDAGLANLY